MKALILTVSAGGGHTKAAHSVHKAIKEKHPDSHVLIVDIFNYINPLAGKIVVGSYINTINSFPSVYSSLYKMAESKQSLKRFSKTINKIMSFKIYNLIKTFKADCIICTYPFALQVMSNIKEEYSLRTPVVGIITDYVSHPLWLYENIDKYVVPHNLMKYEMFKSNILEENILPLGIPFDKQFLIKKDRELVCKELGIENRETILIMGGSLGYGDIKSTYKLLSESTDMQIIIITGDNTRLKKQIEQEISVNENIKVLGFTNKVSDYMDVSDYIITKPGGITITESIIKNLPIFITFPVPGQEERNTEFLLNNGMAVKLFNKSDINTTFYQTIKNKFRIDNMKNTMSFFKKPNTNEDIVKLLENL